MYRGVPHLRATKVCPWFHKHLISCQNYLMAKFVHVQADIPQIADIVHVAQNLAKKIFYHFLGF